MIESINPTTLMDFALAVANWAIQRPDSLQDELEQCRTAIATVCANSSDPIYQGVAILCGASIDVIEEIMTHEPQEQDIEEVEQKELEEVIDNGNSERLRE